MINLSFSSLLFILTILEKGKNLDKQKKKGKNYFKIFEFENNLTKINTIYLFFEKENKNLMINNNLSLNQRIYFLKK